MERHVLVNEIMWEYDLSRPKAEKVVTEYESIGQYEQLCELVKDKKDISMVSKSYV